MSKVSGEGKKQQLGLFDSADPDIADDLPTGKLTPEKAHAILKEQGMDVSLEQATIILSYLRKVASISLPKIINE
jgi:hypothetical protein